MLRRIPVSIPFIAGQWSLHGLFGVVPALCSAFQSPSLRGSGLFAGCAPGGARRLSVSIPFIAGQWSLPGGAGGPGAVGGPFQSPSLRGSGLFQCPAARAGRARCVSIPFIAGQWSLQPVRGGARLRAGEFQSPSLRGSGLFTRRRRRCAGRSACFNPLHCGAVVSSNDVLRCARLAARVSIPFIAGQWSLRSPRSPHGGGAREFQSPSLRGSGLFLHGSAQTSLRSGFNPLHCGAVVSSLHAVGDDSLFALVSIPFIAGQWSLLRVLPALRKYGVLFQSPSLRGSGLFRRRPAPRSRKRGCFNPLHCGAVVSSGMSGKAAAARARFNPLHCGAVVSSTSLPVGGSSWLTSFNPLHCGAVVSSDAGRRRARRMAGFNPLHCGAVVSSDAAAGVWLWRSYLVSIPFIAGQWSLRPAVGLCLDTFPLFQSPSLRGSGLFRVIIPSERLEAFCFNPLHCGAVVSSARRGYHVQSPGRVSIPFIAGQWSLRYPHQEEGEVGSRVSIPFIAGQWSLLRGIAYASYLDERFNPLHCGAVVSSKWRPAVRRKRGPVSIPFIAGQWSLLLRTTPFPVCAVLLPNLRPACDHLLWACLHRWPKPAIIP